jgi:hypothetical protein
VCGRFYSSPLPEGSSCVNHIPEWNEWLTKQIAQFNDLVMAAHALLERTPQPTDDRRELSLT